MSVRYSQRYVKERGAPLGSYLDLSNKHFGVMYDAIHVYDWATGTLRHVVDPPAGWTYSSWYQYCAAQIQIGDNEMFSATRNSPSYPDSLDFVWFKTNSTGVVSYQAYDVVDLGAKFVDYNPTFRQVMAVCSLGGRNFAALFRSSPPDKIWVMRFSLSLSGAMKITSNKMLTVKDAISALMDGNNCFTWDQKLKRFVWFYSSEHRDADRTMANLLVFNDTEVFEDRQLEIGGVVGSEDDGSYRYPIWLQPYLSGRELRFLLVDPAEAGAQRVRLEIDHFTMQKSNPDSNFTPHMFIPYQYVATDPTRGEKQILADKTTGESIMDPSTVGQDGGPLVSMVTEITDWDGNAFSGAVKLGHGFGSPAWPTMFHISRDGRYAVYGGFGGAIDSRLVVFNRTIVKPKIGRGTKRAHFS